MALNVYISGTLVRSVAAFVNTAGAAADPDVITLKYRKDAGSTTTVTYPSAPIVKDATGGYHADLDSTGFAGPGYQLWQAQWQGTGAVVAIGDDAWNIEAPAL
jgi:hypothetical protein